MTTVHRARLGAKAFARLFGQDAARALEALSGRAPTPAELAALGEAAAKRTAWRGRCPTRNDLAPVHRARTFHLAGRAVADAVLVPRRTLRFADPCDTFEPMESQRDKLTRYAGIMLSACAAESYASGSVAHHQPAISIASYSAFVLGKGCLKSLYDAAEDFEWCASLALRHNWPAVELVEARLHAGQVYDDVLIHVARAPANDVRPAHTPFRAAVDGHLRYLGESVAALALVLHQAGGAAQ